MIHQINKIDNVSIIIPIYKPDRSMLDHIISSIKDQNFSGDIEIIEVEKEWGLAKQLNYGIQLSKYSIVVSVHQDCIPVSNNWLSSLIKPLENPNVVACTSDVKDIETNKLYTPKLDEKGCAYRKSALEKVGYFNETIFLNSGEDMDLYMKLKKIGIIEYPHSIVEHYHPGYLSAKGYKKLQNANTNGCLFRVYGLTLPGWWKGCILANIFNWNYFYWYWRGFLLKKQDFKR